MILDFKGKVEIRLTEGAPPIAELEDLVYPGEKVLVPVEGSATLSILGAGVKDTLNPTNEAKIGVKGCSQPASVASRKEQPKSVAEKIHELASLWAKLGFDGMKIGVGVHTGPVIVGTIGSPTRLDHTTIGDTVNTSARIESDDKDSRTEILLFAVTANALSPAERSRLGCQAVEPVPLKGKSYSLELFRVEIDIVQDR